MKLNYVIEFVADRSRNWVHSIPDLSLLLPELNRGSSVRRYRLLAQPIHPSRGVSLP
jgi:hypothetical protein